MDVVEVLYKRFVAWQGERRKRHIRNPEGIDLAELAPRLTLIARALCNAPIEIQPAVREGGWSGHVFHLPARADLFPTAEQNFRFYLHRVFYLSMQRHLGFNWSGEPGSPEASQQAAKDSAPAVLAALELAYVRFGELHAELAAHLDDHSWLHGKWMRNRAPGRQDPLQHVAPDAPSANGKDITTEIASKPVEEMQSLQVDKEKQEEYMLTHNFEKIETAEEFDDIWRDFDGDDSLEDDLQALDDLDLKHTVRVDDVVHSIYRAEMCGQLTVAECRSLEENGTYLPYPEWNSAAGRYLPDHCRVYPLLFRTRNTDIARGIVADHQRTIRELKKQLASFHNQNLRVNRVDRGDDFDLDSVTDLFADIRARSTPDERVYTTRRRRKKDLSLLFLLDLSLSGDGYVSGQKVIDISRQAVIVLGEVFNEFDVEFQVDGFFSKTRNFCSYVTLKHFRDRWAHGKANIAQVAPQGFTRIGPALRHAGFLLGRRDSRDRWVILLSDGKPNDFDRYEGSYGVEDIKQALRELRQQQVNSYAFAIEEQARHYLPRMFGVDHYSILNDPQRLVTSVMRLYTRLAGGV
jgi:nitric oxide reductase NorD protein